MRFGAGFVLVALSLACVTPTLSPDEISVFEKSHGLYELKPPVAHHLETTTSVPCRQGVSFGSELIIAFSKPRKARVPIRAQWTSPAVDGVRPALRSIPKDDPAITARNEQIMISVIDTFGDPRAAVPGQYVLQVVNRETQRVYFERMFEVEGCPPPASR